MYRYLVRAIWSAEFLHTVSILHFHLVTRKNFYWTFIFFCGRLGEKEKPTSEGHRLWKALLLDFSTVEVVEQRSDGCGLPKHSGWQWRAMVVWPTPLVLAWPRHGAALCLAFLWHRDDRRPNTHVPLHTTTAKLWSSPSFFFSFSLSFSFSHCYRKRGSASYIVREVRSVRERERYRERESLRRKWRHLSSAEIGDEFCTFPCQKFAP